MSGLALAPGRAGARLIDLTWLTWRQHRWMVLGTALGVLGYAGYLVFLRSGVVESGSAAGDVDTALSLSSVAAGVIAMFWGAPLLAREYEQRTHLLAWAQDVSRNRWLATKVALLAVVAVALSVVIGVTGQSLADAAHAANSQATAFVPFAPTVFELWWPLQAGYALFGLALGLALSALTRRSVASMGLSLIGFTATRVLLTVFARYHFLPSLRTTWQVGKTAPDALGRDWYQLDQGDLNAAGQVVSSPTDCWGARNLTEIEACTRKHGITEFFATYQPMNRVATFHTIELAIYLALAAALFAVAYSRVRKSTWV